MYVFIDTSMYLIDTSMYLIDISMYLIDKSMNAYNTVTSICIYCTGIPGFVLI